MLNEQSAYQLEVLDVDLERLTYEGEDAGGSERYYVVAPAVGLARRQWPAKVHVRAATVHPNVVAALRRKMEHPEGMYYVNDDSTIILLILRA